jgi:hypothetical protein
MTELVFGVLVPAAVFLVSTWLTWLLYRRFSRKEGSHLDRGH